MKKTKFFRIACLCFAVVFVFLAMPFSASAISNIDNTRVYEDLQTMGTDLSLYKPSSELDTPKIIEFLEYAYDQNNNQSDFGLYLYVYNPSTDKVVTNSQYNTVQISTRSSVGNVTSNKKYKLQFISVSTNEDGEGLDRLYYKFKVATDPLLLTNLSKDRRVYDVVDLELQYEGEANPRCANVSNSYICTGYQAYHHTDPHTGKLLDTSTHYCVAQTLETIEIELHPATWKTTSSDKGEHYQYEVSSVYFSIPDYYLEKYGNMADEDFKGLRAVNGEWYEYKINGVVSDNQSLVDLIDNYEGYQLKTSTMASKKLMNFMGLGNINVLYNSSVPFGFWSFESDADASLNIKFMGFNRKVEGAKNCKDITAICNSIYSNSTDGLLVSTEDLYRSIFGGSSTPYAFNYVDSGRTIGHNLYHIETGDASLNDSIAAFSTEDSKLKNWLSGKGWIGASPDASGYDDIRPISMLDSVDFTESDSSLSDELFVCAEDVSNLRNFVNAQDGRTSYLMRFAVTDYYCEEISISNNDFDLYSGTHHYFEKTIFHNFDVLSFTFQNEEGEFTTVPVSSKPISVVGNITADPDDNNGNPVPPPSEWSLWLKLVVLAVGVIVIVLVMTWLYSKLNEARDSHLDTKLKRLHVEEEIVRKKTKLKDGRRQLRQKQRERRRPKQ